MICREGAWQKFMVWKIHAPLKAILGGKGFTLIDAFKVLKFLNNMAQLPEPTKENTRLKNSHILIDIREELLERLDLSTYRWVFRTIFKWVIIKLDYDRFYEHLLSWAMGEAIKRGWEFSEPHTDRWK